MPMTNLHVRRFAVSAVLFTVVACSSNRDNFVEYVIPDKMTGVFVAEQHRRGADYSGPKVVVDVPPNGVVQAKSLAFLQRWHSLTARYKSGASIKAPGADDKVGEQEIAIWTLFSNADGVYYFVGTERQKERVNKLPSDELIKFMLSEHAE